MIGCYENLDLLYVISFADFSTCGDINITPLVGLGGSLGVAKITFIAPKDDRNTPPLYNPVVGRSP